MPIIIIFTVNRTVSVNLDSNKSILANNQVKLSVKLAFEDGKIEESFYKISDLEYHEKNAIVNINQKHLPEYLLKMARMMFIQ